MYSLAYEMMAQVLRQLGYSGEFQADVAPRAALKEGGRVVLVVQNGNVVSCFIFNKYGRKLYHDAEAHRLLPTFGVLDWKRASTNLGSVTHSASSANVVTPPSMPGINRTANPITPPTAPIIHRNVNPITPPFVPKVTPMEGERRSIPHRRGVSEAQVRTWSALDRSVYFLADGVRSTEQIATLLSRPPALIEQIIQKLKTLGAITQS